MTEAKKLIIMEYVEGGVKTIFYDSNSPVYLSSYTYTAECMSSSSLTATVNYPVCLDEFWNGKQYVTFNGEKYFIKDKPSSKKDNEDARYTHTLTFTSERGVLNNIYFFDVIDKELETDPDIEKYFSQSTEFSFMGDINEFATRLNYALKNNNLQYRITVDNNVLFADSVLVTIQGNTLFEAIQMCYDLYETPFYFDGYTIHFGYPSIEVSVPFEYGIDNTLLSIEKNNANLGIVNEITALGSTENIPYFYPNETPFGKPIWEFIPSSGSTLSMDSIRSVDYLTLSALKNFKYEIHNFDYLYYPTTDIKNTENYTEQVNHAYYDEEIGSWINVNDIKEIDVADYITGNNTSRYSFLEYKIKLGAGSRLLRTADKGIEYKLNARTYFDDNDVYMPISTYIKDVKMYAMSGVLYDEDDKAYVNDDGNMIIVPKNGDGTINEFSLEYTMRIQCDNLGYSADGEFDPLNQTAYKSRKIAFLFSDSMTYYYYAALGWGIDGKAIPLYKAGITLDSSYTPVLGDNFSITGGEYMTPQSNLIPTIFRETNGASRFIKTTDDDEHEYKNPYSTNNVKQYILELDDLKPTIVGMTNADGDRIDKAVSFEYDVDDDDSYVLNADGTSKTYNHPYFYMKLHKTDGTYPFNLFASALYSNEMTISMTSGSCAGCSYKVMVNQDDNSNPYFKKDGEVRFLSGSSVDDMQQDTSENECMLILQKDVETFGTILPSSDNNYKPSADDTFVITNIMLPQAFIESKEAELQSEMIDYMRENNDDKFDFEVKLSRVFLAKNESVFNEISENSKCTVKYNGIEYPFYITNYTYSVSSDEILPDIQLKLARNLSLSQSSLQKMASVISDTIMGGLTDNKFNSLLNDKYLRKDIDDVVNAITTFNKGLKSKEISTFAKGLFLGDFSTGILGTGGACMVDEDGYSHAEFDYLDIRKEAVFNQILIEDINHISGKLILSAASMVCASVIENENYFTCFFNKKSKETGIEIENKFVVGDLAISANFNTSTNARLYWRKVVGIGDNFVNLSKVDGEFLPNSSKPYAGDNIVQLGHATDTNRQSAIILSAVGDGSPSMEQYKSIKSFSLAEADLVTKLSREGNIITGDLRIESSGDKVLDLINDNSDAINTNNTELIAKIGDLQNQVDGQVDNWFYDYSPTLINEPASSWLTNEEKDRHIGDTFTNTQEFISEIETPDAGKSWRWVFNGVYLWTVIADSDAVKALLEASKAQSTADGKRTIYNVSPTAPYQTGDLWLKTVGDTERFYICIRERAVGEAIDLTNDWTLATNYDDKINENKTSISANAEQIELRATKEELDNTKESIISQTAESISLSVSSIKVGGRNLLLDTGYRRLFQATTNYSVIKYTTTEALKPNTEYMLSIEKGECTTAYYDAILYNPQNGNFAMDNVVKVKASTDRVIVSLTTNSDVQSDTVLYVYAGEMAYTMDNSLYLTNVQLEEGNKATSYKEAQEDLEDGIKKTGIDIESGKITVLADNFEVQGGTEENPIKVAVFYVDDNGNPLLKAANIDVDNLVAKKLDCEEGLIAGLVIKDSALQTANFEDLSADNRLQIDALTSTMVMTGDSSYDGGVTLYEEAVISGKGIELYQAGMRVAAVTEPTILASIAGFGYANDGTVAGDGKRVCGIFGTSNNRGTSEGYGGIFEGGGIHTTRIVHEPFNGTITSVDQTIDVSNLSYLSISKGTANSFQLTGMVHSQQLLIFNKDNSNPIYLKGTLDQLGGNYTIDGGAAVLMIYDTNTKTSPTVTGGHWIAVSKQDNNW